MSETTKLKLRTNKAEQPKEIVLIQHVDRTFSFPLWVPIFGLIIYFVGEVLFFIKEKFPKFKI